MASQTAPRVVVACAALFVSLMARGQQAMVTAALTVPPLEAYVIGDNIPLLWEFTNHGRDPLAFMWEGCCRLNGRLTVTCDEEPLPPRPPGAATAHAFARAAVLEPGRPQTFETRLSDWVVLSKSGVYQLQGHYVGVLSNQQPQVPKSVALWRGQASTAPFSLPLLTVTDYLAQGNQRSTQRELRLNLSGPSQVPPLEKVLCHLSIQNLSADPLVLDWPGAAQLWIVDAMDRRIGTHHPETSAKQILLASGGRDTVPFWLGAKDWLDGPLGSYRVFINLPGTSAGEPGLPSEVLRVQWDLDCEAVLRLLREAAKGPVTGLRNPALRLLRVYLGVLSEILEGVDLESETEAVAELGRGLLLASCLKPYAPEPGAVWLSADIDPDGIWSIHERTIESCLPKSTYSVLRQLQSILAVRRHLGWSLELILNPAEGATIQHIMTIRRQLEPLLPQFAGPPWMALSPPGSSVTNRMTPQLQPISANMIVRLESLDGPQELRIGLARRFPDPQTPQKIARFSPEEMGALRFDPIPDPEAWRAVMSDGHLTNPNILVLADPRLSWKAVMKAIGPLLEYARPLDLGMWEHSPGN